MSVCSSEQQSHVQLHACEFLSSSHTQTFLCILTAQDEESVRAARESEKAAKARLVEIQQNMKVRTYKYFTCMDVLCTCVRMVPASLN
jgi:hypothetical protein